METLLYLVTGVCAGLLSGLLGVGGGLIIVPLLTLMFTRLQFPDAHIMHLALGTSLATIIATSISSARSHHRHGNVNWQAVRRIAPGILIGALLGAGMAAQLHSDWLKWLFALFVLYVGTQMLLDFSPPPGHRLPGTIGLATVGALIGTLSSLVGIGGGTLSVPFLIYCNCPARSAIGTSASIGIFIALAGSTGYIAAGWQVTGLPESSLGFVYLPAFAGITLASIVSAPLGVRLAQRLPVALLKKLFALLLYALGLKMLWSLL
jgi:uncharacterized membrane protein YfcA